MAYIYLITNDINGKQYVGKTYYNNIQERWKEHCRDYKRPRCEKRPLYDAMNKYGIEHFHIEEIEYVPPEVNLEEREIYWVAQYNTYYNGYNATLGGDGKHFANYELIYKFYQQGKTCKEISQITGYDGDTIQKALRQYNITQKELVSRGRKFIKHKVAQIDIITEQVLNIFDSIQEAYIYLNKQHSGHIASVCQGKRKTAYGYKWKYIE